MRRVMAVIHWWDWADCIGNQAVLRTGDDAELDESVARRRV